MATLIDSISEGTRVSYHMSEATDESEWEVEAIVNSRKRTGRVQYLVKWLGFSDSENSWQYEEDLVICPERVEEYIQRTQTKTSSSPRRGRNTASGASRRRAKETAAASIPVPPPSPPPVADSPVVLTSEHSDSSRLATPIVPKPTRTTVARESEPPNVIQPESPPPAQCPVACAESPLEAMSPLEDEPPEVEPPIESEAAPRLEAPPEPKPSVMPTMVVDGFMREDGDELVLYYRMLLPDGTTRVFSGAEARKLKGSIIANYLIGMFDPGTGCYYSAFTNASAA
jgi:hypothetical protein